MYSDTKRELLSGIQYLLIGIIAEGVVLVWFNARPIHLKMGIWIVVAFTLSFARSVILGLTSKFRKNRWTTIEKRHWN